MLLSAVSVLVVAQSSSEITEGLMNNPVYTQREEPGSYNPIFLSHYEAELFSGTIKLILQTTS